MSTNMKYFFILLLFHSGISSACRTPPIEVLPSAQSGFAFSLEPPQPGSCEKCSGLNIKAPKEYEGVPYNHGFFNVFKNGKLVSRAELKLSEISGSLLFIGFVSSESEFSYEVTFEYGSSYCSDFEFLYRGDFNDS